MAQELGLFARHGLSVELHREIGWATIRDKILFGELEAAHAPAGMLLAATAGLNTVPVECLTALVLNLHGNAIVLSQKLARAGATNGHQLRELVRRKKEKLTLGVVYQWSSHHVQLRLWLREHGIDPDRDAQVVVVPPSQVYANLRAGHLDGYCVGEPWASLAVMNKAGIVVARSAEIAPLHVEKVLMVRRAFAERAHDEHLALAAALLEACAWCDAPGNRDELVSILSRQEYVNVPAEALRMSLCGAYDFGMGRVEQCPGIHIFHRDQANAPTAGKAAMVAEGFIASGLASRDSLPAAQTAQCFREDLHQQVLTRISKTQTNAA